LIKAQGLRKQSSLLKGAKVYQTFAKQTSQRETIQPLTVVVCVLLRGEKLRNSLKLNPTNHLFGFGEVCFYFSLFYSQGQDHKINAMTITFSKQKV